MQRTIIFYILNIFVFLSSFPPFLLSSFLSLSLFFNVLMHFCLCYCTEHVKGTHVFSGCVLLTCQVSVVPVQAGWEDWELAGEIGDEE